MEKTGIIMENTEHIKMVYVLEEAGNLIGAYSKISLLANKIGVSSESVREMLTLFGEVAVGEYRVRVCGYFSGNSVLRMEKGGDGRFLGKTSTKLVDSSTKEGEKPKKSGKKEVVDDNILEDDGRFDDGLPSLNGFVGAGEVVVELPDYVPEAMERNESIVKRLDRIAKGKSRLLEEEEKPELEDLGEHMASAMSAREKKCYKDHVLTGKAVVKEKDYSTVIECEKCNIRYEIQK
jgi:hypothetical protein